MTEGEPKPIKARVLRPTSTVAIRLSPLDESGFFKNGKTHDNIHNGIVCGCLNCRRMVVKEIFKGGIFTEAEAEHVLLRYQDVALKTHQVRRG